MMFGNHCIRRLWNGSNFYLCCIVYNVM